jgi:hypothetical protein
VGVAPGLRSQSSRRSLGCYGGIGSYFGGVGSIHDTSEAVIRKGALQAKLLAAGTQKEAIQMVKEKWFAQPTWLLQMK